MLLFNATFSTLCLVYKSGKDAFYSLRDNILSIFGLLVIAFVKRCTDEEKHDGEKHSSSRDSERQRIAIVAETLDVIAEYWRYNRAYHTTDVDAQIKQREERLEILLLSRTELVASESTHTWFNTLINKPAFII